MKPLINILVRTSNRPNYFARCIKSILSQSYKHFRIIVSVDDLATEQYVIPYGLDYFKVDKKFLSIFQAAPYNLYLNTLTDQVHSGFILILDDDDTLAHDRVLEHIAINVTTSERLLIWRMQWPDGTVIPQFDGWRKRPDRGQIGMPCFLYHHSWGKAFRFDLFKAADFRFFGQLYNQVPEKIWIDEVFIRIGNKGLRGKPTDLD